jgi:hypothetical protein
MRSLNKRSMRATKTLTFLTFLTLLSAPAALIREYCLLRISQAPRTDMFAFPHVRPCPTIGTLCLTANYAHRAEQVICAERNPMATCSGMLTTNLAKNVRCIKGRKGRWRDVGFSSPRTKGSSRWNWNGFWGISAATWSVRWPVSRRSSSARQFRG